MVQETSVKDCRGRGGLREPTRDVFYKLQKEASRDRENTVLLEPGESCGERVA